MPEKKLCVIGLGYVGLPLALAFARERPVIGVDTDSRRVAELKQGFDRSGEIGADALCASPHLTLSDSLREAADCSAYFVTVPTPVFADHTPNLQHLQAAISEAATVIQPGDLLVVESTVCPGTTESLCARLITETTGLCAGKDFDLAYSPERISPGDRGLSKAIKIISASDDKALSRVRALYEKIIPAGLHEAPSIKVAEAAKLAENIQRDVDIAVTNQLAMLFDRMEIDSDAVFAAAATKWNYRRFSPGLVGGHCIGVDSYYLIDYADRHRHPAPLLHAARQINNQVPLYVADIVLQHLRERRKTPRALILGYAFKENCADIRNTMVEPMRRTLVENGIEVTICDPVADAEKAKAEYGITIVKDWSAALSKEYGLIIFAVAHRQFQDIPATMLGDAFVADIKGAAPRADWTL